MKIGSIKYLVGEGVKNTWVNRLMTIASVGVLVACMVIIGLAILISENVNKAIGNLEQQNVVMAYITGHFTARMQTLILRIPLQRKAHPKPTRKRTTKKKTARKRKTPKKRIPLQIKTASKKKTM